MRVDMQQTFLGTLEWETLMLHGQHEGHIFLSLLDYGLGCAQSELYGLQKSGTSLDMLFEHIGYTESAYIC